MAANGRQDYVTGARLLRPLAEQGNAEAQAILGNMYRVGRGVPQDFAEAIKWYRKAVAQGNSMAQRSFGDMYEHGWGVAKDDAEAAKWHRMAADQGDVGLAGGMRSPPPQDDVDFTQAKHVRTVPIFGGGTLAEPANMMPIASDAQLAANQGGGTQANPKPQLNLADVSQLLSKDAPQQRASTGRELSPVASPIPAHASEAQLAELDQLIDAAYRSCWNYGGGQSSAYIPEILLDFQATGALASGPILQNPPPFDADRPLAVAAMRIASNCVVHVPQKFWPFAAEYEKRVLRFDPRVMGAAFEFR
jgi:hypothetical protein